MKVFSANDVHWNPATVYRAADKDGAVRINHNRYPHMIFILSARERKPFGDIPPDLSDKFKKGDTVTIGGQKFLVGDKVCGDEPIKPGDTITIDELNNG